MNSNYAVIIAAGGSGQRFGQDKQFFEVEQEPIVIKTIRKFQQGFAMVVVVTSDISKMSELIAKYHLKVDEIVLSGEQRRGSIANGLQVLKDNIDYVLIHDGARPNVTIDLIDRIKQEVIQRKAVIPVVNVKDTIKLVGANNTIEKTLNRNQLVAVQTPQAFELGLIKSAYQQNSLQLVTDDASLVELLGETVFTIDGEDTNIKVTTKQDIRYIIS